MDTDAIDVDWHEIPPEPPFSYKLKAVYKYFGLNGYVWAAIGILCGLAILFIGGGL